MRALVTGATGFLGGHVVEHLLERGAEVRCLVRRGSDRSVLPAAATLVEGDLEDAAALDLAVEGADVVIHSGALTRKLRQRREDLFRVNEGGTASLLDACARRPRPPRFVFVSTLASVGPGDGRDPIDETSPCRPLNDYGDSKRAAELVVLAARDRVPATIVRLPGVFGRRDPNLLPLFRLVARGLRPVGSRTVTFVHVLDAAEALALTAERPEAEGEVFHAAADDLSIGEMGRAIASALGTRTLPLPMPSGLVFAAARIAEASARWRGVPVRLDRQKARDLTATWRVSSEKIRTRLGWRPTRTFEEGMRESLAWYRERGLLA